MDLIQSRYASYGVFVFGLLMLVITVEISFQTLVSCQLDSTVYDMIGIHPTRSSVKGVSPPGLGGPYWGGSLLWNDGCNTRESPLLFAVLGIVGTTTGLVLIGKDIYRRLLSD